MNRLSINLRRRTFLLLALLLMGGMASAQVTIKGNVYGGGRHGAVKNITTSQGETPETVINNTSVTINDGTVEGCVYGGGEGALLDITEPPILAENAGLVEGNATVIMTGGQVKESIYGGGQLGSVGKYTEFVTTPNNFVSPAVNVDIPTACMQGTGLTTVKISGGLVGITNPLMPSTIDPGSDIAGYVFCGGQGEADSTKYIKANLLGVVGSTYLEISKRDNVAAPLIAASVYGGCENGLVLGNTHVKIMGGQIGIGYYKSQNGANNWDPAYSDEQWQDAIDAVAGGIPSEINAIAAQFHECDAFAYQAPYSVYDIYADTHEYPSYNSHGGSTIGLNGHTFFGNVFGGGSGFYPYAPGQWRRMAGQVNGNTHVEILGGHILTSVYGGNEITDVIGSCTVEMSGGTLGVPRTLDGIAAHPVTCYLFGAGMGDPRILFNKWTDIKQNVTVNVSGGSIFGSIFGGGEDGHVIGDITMTISDNAKIGTWGYSYVDGNVFGGGRGFAGDALTAGSVGGNINLNIQGGTMLGSIYGGGRLASVGTKFAYPTLDNGDPNPDYGQMQGEGHGKITVDISGGTIGNDYESKLHLKEHTYGGNVFGGSMGRLVNMDNTTTNPLWPDLAKAKETEVTIREAENSHTIIKGNVYGGAEYGTVTENAQVKIQGGTIWREVFGGGRGDINDTRIGNLKVFGEDQGQATVTEVPVKPIQWAGRVRGNASVNVEGGWVKKCIFGGGELASVGTITDSIKHIDDTPTFPLSWPYEMSYKNGTGRTTVNLTGGRVGLTGKDYMGPWNAAGQPIYYTYDTIKENGHVIRIDEIMHVYTLATPASRDSIKAAREDNGDVYGAGKGKAGDRYKMAHLCNVDKAVVTINETTTATPGNYKPDETSQLCLGVYGTKKYDFVHHFIPTYDYEIPGLTERWSTYYNRGCLAGALYGGGENGHVNNRAYVTLEKGLVGHNIYGGGKGSDTYETWLGQIDPATQEPIYNDQGQPILEKKEITSITAGKVYGNTYVTMNGGYVVRNVYGGGNRASVGKGNYAGGPGDFTTDGYGEQWSDQTMYLRDTLVTRSGHTYVYINGGTVGTINGMKDDLPTGNVFGSSRGEAAPNVRQTLTPRILYYPEFFLGYVNHTHVVIGKAESNSGVGTDPGNEPGTRADNGPRLFGSVFGGGQDGHVRWSTEVVVNKGEIGNKYDDATIGQVGTSDLTDYQWRGRGSVYGAGAGLGKYLGTDGREHYSTSAGSVTQFTEVNINGGIIHQNVYGGGPLSSVGPPAMGQPTVPSTSYSLAKVNIHSAIGDEDVVKQTEQNNPPQIGAYGGSVFGASRGVFNFEEDPSLSFDRFGTSMFTEVNLYPGAKVPGNVFGGGQLAQVKNDTKVNMYGGTVGTIEYVHKRGIPADAAFDSIVHSSGGEVFGGGAGYPINRDAALVKGNTEVNISDGHVLFNVYGGGEMASVGLRDSIFKAEPHTLENLKDFAPKANTGYAKVTITGGQVGPAPMFLKKDGSEAGANDSINIPIGLNGVDGYVFGGGKGMGTVPTNDYRDFANVNYTSVKVDIPADADTDKNRIWGSIFGGAEDGHVLGSDTVRFVSGLMGTYGTTSYDGNIFGGGRNYNHMYLTSGRVRGNITVEMSGGQIYGSIFGGGRLGGTGIDYYGLIIDDEEGEKFGQIDVKVMGGVVGNPDTIHGFTKYSIGDVFGGGKGSMDGVVGHDRTSALLLSISKNTNVEISQKSANIPTKILGSVYGGGEVANVGTCTWQVNDNNQIVNVTPVRGTGVANVTVKGGQIGVDHMIMNAELAEGEGNFNLKYNTDVGHVFGGGEGVIADPYPSDTPDNPDPDNPLINGGTMRLAEGMANVFDTHVTIEGGWVKGSVYGGGNNGNVWWDTDVKIKGGQIGAGYYPATENTPEKDSLYYGEGQFFNPLEYFANDAHEDVAPDKALAECYHWPYGEIITVEGQQVTVYNSYDPLLMKLEGRMPSDGKTWFGNVFGGGSGYYPFVKKNADNEYQCYWNRRAGLVKGNTSVEITGGHILTSVYGGCEVTDVGEFDYTNGINHVSGGKATVKMSGGTLGVPRTFTDIAEHPVTCYLFGAGKGDPRTWANTWTNVHDVEVEVSGGTIYGSIFGGGEEGHVITDVDLTVSGNAIIGTTGRSYVDGNVFGGGRGYSGEALTAGSVGGNIDVFIKGGNMLGSIYGGGRLSSVGSYFVAPDDVNYGQLQAGDNHGFVTIDITGGTIGNEYEDIFHTDFSKHSIGGNVFAGSMGRLTLLDNSPNPLWPNLGKVKETEVNILQAATSDTTLIRGNVYGGGEFGTVVNNSTITVSGGTIKRDVYGGGFGSSEASDSYKAVVNPNAPAGQQYSNTPMQLSGRVGGNSTITIEGGWIQKCVYGGGELATVGTILADSIKHTTESQLALSWPYKFNYKTNTGKADITVKGGRIGITGKDFMGPYAMSNGQLVPVDADGNPLTQQQIKDARVDNGDIYGGGKGISGNPYLVSHMSGLDTTNITINYTTLNVNPTNYKDNPGPAKGCITGAVYGGGENGYVNNNTYITMTKGLVGHAIYGGGKGKDKYTNAQGNEVYSLTDGKVYGNTNIDIIAQNKTDAYVVRSVFGGGNTASVGKGNYIDYGETAEGEYLTQANNSGKSTITITGGTIGMLPVPKSNGMPDPEDAMKDGIPYGSVFGGSRGLMESAAFDNLSDNTNIESRLSFINNTEITVGSENASNDKILIHGSVYGGAQDGHVRRDTDVTVFSGEIGVEYQNPSHADSIVGSNRLDTIYWVSRGNVLGGGSGVSYYEAQGHKQYSSVAGSVMGNTNVEINGGLIHCNVYGGSVLGSIGSYKTIDGNTVCAEGTGKTQITINGGEIGVDSDVCGSYGEDDETFNYGGHVFGAGRGFATDVPQLRKYCTVDTTSVVINGGEVLGEVYGGGEQGRVSRGTNVEVHADASIGTIGNSGYDGNIYGGGKGSGNYTFSGPRPDTISFDINKTCGRVGGNTYITMDGGSIKGSIYGGGSLALTGVNENGEFPATNWDVAKHGNTFINVSEAGSTETQIGTTVAENVLNTFYSVGDIFGSGKGDIENYMDILAGRVTNSTITITGGTTHQGSVFGGGEMASIGWWGNDNKFYPKTGMATITIGTLGATANPSFGTSDEFDAYLENGKVYIGQGNDKYPSPWSILDEDGNLLHTCTGNVFGGGQGEVDPTAPHWVSMARSREAEITIYGGNIMSKVIGGSEQGSVDENTKILVYGGTVGSIDDGTNFGGVFGGGYGSDDPDEAQNTNNDLHEPSALVAGRVYGNTEVRIVGGTMNGNVYGGGERAYVGTDENTSTGNTEIYIGTATEANAETGELSSDYEGNATFVGTASVFGANKFEGTPLGNVTVHIIKTAHEPDGDELGDWYPKDPHGTTPTTPEELFELDHNPENFAIYQVFGAGDQSDYLPQMARATTSKKSTVAVYLCDENTIYQVYGGGNAAKVGKSDITTSTNVNIFGGRMHQVFGGGKGDNAGNISADIHGVASTTIYAGLIDELYGGGNQLGNIDVINLVVNENVGECPEIIGEVFGGSNEAPITGDVVTIVECTPENPAHYGELYGGCNNATIYGNVTTNVYGGRIGNLFGGSKGGTQPADIRRFPTQQEINEAPSGTYSEHVIEYLTAHPDRYGRGGIVKTNLYGGIIANVFGGSNVNGNIDSLIMVNVTDAELACPLDLTNIYGASKSTPYTPEDILVMMDGETELQKPNSPIVNVVHIKQEPGIRGNVFGGAKGHTATVTSNPVVNIGYDNAMSPYIPTIMGGYTSPTGQTNVPYNVNDFNRQALVSGNVYGGGSEAQLEGNTQVTVQTEGQVGRIAYGYKQGNTSHSVFDTLYHVKYQDVVNEAFVEVDDYGGKVFGGGKGLNHPNTQTAIYADTALMRGNSNVYIKGGHVLYSVYGGGEMASIAQKLVGNTPVANTGKATVTVTGGQVGPARMLLSKSSSAPGTNDSINIPVGLDGLDGYVFGGGEGNHEDPQSLYKTFANVESTEVIIDMSTVDTIANRLWGSVFGGGEDGHVIGDATVRFNDGLMGTDGTTSYDGNIFGGGRNYLHRNYTAGRVGGNINVFMSDGTLYGSIFGGGRLGITGIDENGDMIEGDNHGKVTVDVNGGTVGNIKKVLTWDRNSIGDVFGGGKGSLDTIFNTTGQAITLPEHLAKVKNTVVKISDKAQVLGNVFGGGENASVGWLNDAGNACINGTGFAKVSVSGGQVGVETEGQSGITDGYVFGGGIGIAGGRKELPFGNVDTTSVSISGDAYIVSGVFGGGDNGHVWRSTNVYMKGGIVGKKNTLVELYTDSLDQVNTHIYTGSVLGGGRGIDTDANGRYNDTTGRVFGDTYVTIKGGTVRHAVYGGGGLSSVGTYTIPQSVPEFSSGGKTYVTVDSCAFIGPRKADLIHPTPADLTAASDFMGYTVNEEKYIDLAFKHIGGNAGWVFGAGCGLAGEDFRNLTFNDSTYVTIAGNAQVVGTVFGGGENGHVARSTVVNVNGGVIGGFPLHGDVKGESTNTYTITGGEYDGVTVHLDGDESEVHEDEYGAGILVFRGNVFGGGKGTDNIAPAGQPYQYDMFAGRVFANTNVTVSDPAVIYNRVYGGGSIASVGTFTYHETYPTDYTIPLGDSIQRISYSNSTTGIANVTIKGGTIGTDGRNNGDVVGGGRGLVGNPHGFDTINPAADGADQAVRLAYVGSTNVTITKEDGKTEPIIKSNVYGGSINGHVYGDTHVNMDAGTVGYVYKDNDVTKVHGGWHSNVFGGGGGSHQYIMDNGDKHLNITSGRVYGNTNVNITGGNVVHNVYGGGAIASVGTYDLRSTSTNPLVKNTGTATVDIKGGIIGVDESTIGVDGSLIGISGNNNGMVFGSGRGQIQRPNHYLDSLSYAGNTFVNIGNEDGAFGDLKVKGSVYGSGENGHVFQKAIVNVYSGFIGCDTIEFAAIQEHDDRDSLMEHHFPYRGNVYGAGCGTDLYDPLNDTLSYNPKSGMVQGNTEVNIFGGYISHNVYGGGAMASVGTSDAESYQHNVNDSLSWPHYLHYIKGTGAANVNINGGHIGTVGTAPMVSGNVYGSSKGLATFRYLEAPFANVDTTHVTINFETTSNNILHKTPNCIYGSVYGSGENGHVHNNTFVEMTDGLVNGSVFGGGNGSDTYWDSLARPQQTGVYYKTLVRSITAGKVYGNTNVTINGGTVLHNVYGGGNMASVGKSNYYGYGENGNDENVQNSGHCKVTINNGTIGTNGYDDGSGYANGYVFGSSRGLTFENISDQPRYKYSRDFFLGYSNHTEVTIGDGVEDHHAKVWGSVFGGGDNGHVRYGTDVVINQGAEIGVTYAPAEGETINHDKWKYRGNVYGAGRGIDLVPGSTPENPEFCPSAGSVTINTHVTVNGGNIHRNVYGGGSLATVGPPPIGIFQNASSLCTVDILGGTIGDATSMAMDTEYGGNVYGSSRGEIAAPGHQFDELATVKETVVNIGKKANEALSGSGLVHGSVYGSGENGHTSTNATVNVYSGSVGDNSSEVSKSKEYCGNVFGGGDGTDTYIEGGINKYNSYGGIVKGNTFVNVEGGWVMRSVYGGGEMASVGTISNDTVTNASGVNPAKHTDAASSFALSWPFEFQYLDNNNAPNNTGKTTINIIGGRIGITGKDADMDNGDVYGGSKGISKSTIAYSPYALAHFANVKETEININYNTLNVTPEDYKTAANTNAAHGCITGAVYGGSENGHVNENTNITFTKGLVGHAIYGGGKGKGKYGPDEEYSLTSGKVYGNTSITINADDNANAYVVRSVFGGGNLASVGKGNYAGYGEMNGSNQWSDTLNSGHTYINITGGTLGMLPVETDGTINPGSVVKDNIPYGSVFGGCRGEVVADNYDYFGHVNNTHVTIGTAQGSTGGSANGPKLYGSVYGGAQDGHVRWNTNVTVNKGQIGAKFGTDNIGVTDPDDFNWTSRGNVLGGGSGLNTYKVGDQNKYNPNAGSVTGNTKVVVKGGEIYRHVFGGGNRASVGKFHKAYSHPTGETELGHTRVFIDGGTIGTANATGNLVYGGDVYGGGNSSFVEQERVVTVSDGTVRGNVYGGSNMAVLDMDTTFLSLKTVNVRGGHIMGNVFGCSHDAEEGDPDNSAAPMAFTGFVNISGGTIDQDVFAAGNGGLVTGSLDVNIGATAIANTYEITGEANKFRYVTIGDVNNTAAPGENDNKDILIIAGNVYGGSDHYGGSDAPANPWNGYDVNGYSVMFIDGTGYETSTNEETTANYMNIGGGLYGSGKNCESGQINGQEARGIVVRNYGHRTGSQEYPNELVQATRSLTTIQRGGIIMLENSNLNLTGAYDISNSDAAQTSRRKFGVEKALVGLYVTDASGLVLGSGALNDSVMIDSVKLVKSLYLPTDATVYNQMGSQPVGWEVVGIQGNTPETAKMYRLHDNNGTITPDANALTAAEENVIIFNDRSKMRVRYKDNADGTIKYGELEGFFRMRGNYYHPTELITESFAYARPKITDDHEFEDDNIADGGFLSYNTGFNYFTDLGDIYTHTNQHPYINVLDYTRGDREDYRMWVDVSHKRHWYVDGTRGWGRDDKKKYREQSGLFPDKPKYTLYGKDEDGKGIGIVNEKYTHSDQLYLNYSHKDDVIYVVGAISAADEKEMLRDSTYTNDETFYPLKLYRYPGGHIMSNGNRDYGGAKQAIWGQPNGEEGDELAAYRGPGANYGAMLNVQGAETAENAASLEMRGVLMDGLYGYTPADTLLHEIYNFTLPEDSKFKPELDSLPLVLTHRNSTLTMHGGTVLKRGYNNQNAVDWYTDSDYKSYRSSGTPIYNGGAMFVDSLAIVNVSGLDSIVGNKQYLKIGDGPAEIIECNVYQPTFNTHLYITDVLDPITRIGVTSPNRNKEPNYVANTFSPVAVATRVGEDENHQPYSTLDARSAWENNNFYDDLNWFFVKGHVDDNNARTTYYGALEQFDRVSFGWTWANVVRKQPSGYAEDGNAISISSEQGLAWLISVVNGMNRQTASDLNEKTVSLVTVQNGDIKDIYDMQQYVWVPVGGNPSGQPFAGTFDGNGHLITELYVDYLGKGDRIYKYNEYGMFGRVNGTIDRTFLVSGMIRPDCTIDLTEAQTYNVGGLVGILNGSTSMVSNSEAAMEIKGPKKDNLSTVAGGLVGQMNAGEVHSSMAMPDITVGPSSTMAGLVGSSSAGNINNSFVHATLTVDGTDKTDIMAGGLLGVNTGAKMENCYLATITPTNLSDIIYDSIVASNNSGTVDYSYVMTKYTGTGVGEHCGYYAPVITADELGYMYADNRVNTGSNTDTTLFVQLNRWVDNNNGSGHKYARWARPGLSEINGDLPVLMLSEYDKTNAHQGGFRSMGTYKGGPVLQYGGPVRDVNEVGTALTRSQADVDKKDHLFIYGDVVNNIKLSAGESITQGKVSIYEHAAILSVGDLADFENTYVGITFDNSKRHALSTHGVNGLGMQDLPRDWHMMSTPLSKAPLGFNYYKYSYSETAGEGISIDSTFTNDVGYNGGNQGTFYNNPWYYPNSDFSWLVNDGQSVDNRYWMKGWRGSQIETQEFDPNTWVDGYFPSKLGDGMTFGNTCIPGADEAGRYPYGMDLFTWYEPQYHWVNFKRNGPNHWHSDEPHFHLDYYYDPNHYGEESFLNKNEEYLIKGKGYMASIAVPTFLQSHGKLNSEASIKLTKEGTYCTGWNLVGNPFHGYLDFDLFASNNSLGDGAFYVIYDADGFEGGYPESAFLYYPKQGSENGAYAGRYLHPHQGFFLYAYKEEIAFNESSIVKARALLGNTDNFDGHFRGEDLPRYPLVNLFLTSDNGCSDVTVVEFERPEWGGAIKLPELRVGDGLFYGYHEGKRYAALFAQEGTTRVPLWFEAKEDDIFTMKWNTANGDFTSLYLIDNLKGIEYDMLANDTYTFEGHKEDYYSRFYIVFNVNDVEEHHEHSIAFFDGSQWVVTGEGELDFIDLQGRILWHGKLSGGQTRVNFPVVAKGMYLLRLVNPDETKVQKIIVK